MNSVRALVFVTLVAACDSASTTDPFLPRKGVEIVLDSAVYHLEQRGPRFFSVNLGVTVINESDHDVYLAQGCGTWGLQRAGDDGSSLELGRYGCSGDGGEPRPAPILVAAGASYTKVFELSGSLQPQAGPPITLEHNIGNVKFRLSFTNPSVTTYFSLESQPFTVRPPA